jgi:hypothetical protein
MTGCIVFFSLFQNWVQAVGAVISRKQQTSRTLPPVKFPPFAVIRTLVSA